MSVRPNILNMATIIENFLQYERQKYGGSVAHNKTKSSQHNEIAITQRIGLILLFCGLFPLCCANFVLWLVSIVLR